MSKRFVFDGTEDAETPRGPKKAGPLDALVSAAGGQPLPGSLGLAQAVFGVWSRSYPRPGTGLFGWGLYGAQSSLNTIGVVRKYAEPTEVPKVDSPVDRFLDDNDLMIPPELKKLGGLVYAFSMGLVEHEDIVLGESKDKKLLSGVPMARVFDGGGFRYAYMFYAYDPKVDAPGSMYAPSNGPYVLEEDIGKMKEHLADIIWESYDGDIQLDYIRDSKSYDDEFSLTSIGEPEAHVEEDGGDLEKLANRCKRMQDAGIPRRVLLYGHPGTGKSSSARALADLISDGDEGRTLRVDPSALNVGGADRVLAFVRILQPSVVLFDDIDRCGSISALLRHLEDSKVTLKNTTVIGTVNAIKAIDPALLRPGRFDEVKLVDPPDNAKRLRIVTHYLEANGIAYSAQRCSSLNEKMEGMTPAEIREVIQTCATVGTEYFDDEIMRVRIQSGLYSGDQVEEYLRGR